MVRVAGTIGELEILERRRIELVDPAIPDARQPYHAAEHLPPAERDALVLRLLQSAYDHGRRALDGLLDGAAAVGLVGGPMLERTDASYVLAAHARMHATEGALFQDVIRRAAQAKGLPVLAVPEKQVFAEAALALNRSPEDLEAKLAATGKQVGPPWQHDHKLATLVALLALDRTP